ncbi:hypothetical protein SAMN05216570_2514 [Dyella sp. OK004]|uniref:hypothetical protein n=1 Tax=Dyella sp. OK004 TaxID=1855292 RepID=UPI0008E6A238|nr:hypothetical protein [Dyella sp. OK004]SFS09105.1 hypothetical protein SAMN05216570_2514 [Dyella sp. OK004]
MTPTTPQAFIIRRVPGIGQMPWIEGLTCALLALMAALLFKASSEATPGSFDGPGLFMSALAVSLLTTYRLGKAIVEHLPLSVSPSGQALLWRFRLAYRNPQKVLLEHNYKLWFRTYVVYDNGRLFVAEHHDHREDEAFANELAAFLGVAAYKNDSSGKLRKLASKKS